MVNIDTVYQKVLNLASKEQRGYITPQEFNLFADQAQKEIFEQYFYDLDQLSRGPENPEEYAGITSNLREKIAIFENTGTIVANTITPIAGDVFYRLGEVISLDPQVAPINILVEEIQHSDAVYLSSSLLNPFHNFKFPVYVRDGAMGLTIFPTSTTANYSCRYTRIPTTPSWGYFVVSEKALYDPNQTKTTHFELHPSDESELVYKILKFAGISMKAIDIMRAGQIQEQSQVQQEKQ
tara:strand:- start:793 stop:1506 length:714 start_codon:yes stop_codon:yes gene_type:complete